MCPMGLILMFLSSTLAVYFSWKSIRSNSDEDYSVLATKTTPENASRPSKTISAVIVGGFFILVFLSATLAGYFAWKSIRSNSDEDSSVLTAKTMLENASRPSKTISAVIVGGFWGSVDMASGRYLWMNLRVISEERKKRSFDDLVGLW